MSTVESEEELKAKECVERQTEMDAIAAFRNQQEFPSVASAHLGSPAEASGTGTGQQPTSGPQSTA